MISDEEEDDECDDPKESILKLLGQMEGEEGKANREKQAEQLRRLLQKVNI